MSILSYVVPWIDHMKSDIDSSNKRSVKFPIIAIALFGIAFSASALDKNGNFESKQEQDTFIAATLKKTASELNSQTPIQVDEDTRLMNVIALQKTITYNFRLNRLKFSDVDPSLIAKAARENLNHSACQVKATRTLIDLGVEYAYLYSDKDGKLITRVAINKYRC